MKAVLFVLLSATAVAVAVAVVPVAVLLALAGGTAAAPTAADRPAEPVLAGIDAPPPGGPVGDIPPDYLTWYVRAASRCPGLPWTVLAAIGKVETDHGRGGLVSPAGAQGPMQFMPATWAAYGVDGDGDGVASVNDPADAIPAAADYLCVNGARNGSDFPAAIWAYNHDAGYVRLVLSWAMRYTSEAVGVAA